MRISLLILFIAGRVLFGFGEVHAAPNIQHWQTVNGLRVYFVPAPEIPIIDLRLVLDAGSARDGTLSGLATLTKGLLKEGSGDWDADTIAQRFEEVGAKYSAQTQRDMTWIALRSLSDTEWFSQALETYIRVVTAPNFPERDYERNKKYMQVYLQSQAQRPSQVGEKAFYRAIYGNHPFARPINGTQDGINAIRREDVVRFYRRYYVTGNAVLAMVGDLDRKQAERIAESLSSRMRVGAAAPALPEVRPLDGQQIKHIPFPSEQAHIFIGQPGIKRGDEDYFKLYVGNHVLGGSGFSSRLVKEIRVNRGLSYSVYSYFLPQMVEGPFEVGLQTRADQAEEAAALVKQTIRDFIINGPDQKELEASIKNITGGFPLRIDSNDDIVSYVAIIGFYNLPLDYLDTFNSNIEAVDRVAVQEAFRRRVNVDDMVTVIVGGKEGKGG
jgi:zinc protease